jgi:Leucine-rich repeat (LRR) protein
VNGNQITDLATLSGSLQALSELYVHDNNVRDVAPLVTRCPRLESLDVRSNSISKLDCVLRLVGCEALQDLWIQGNPCCQSDRCANPDDIVPLPFRVRANTEPIQLPARACDGAPEPEDTG